MPLSWLENERTQFPVGTADGASNRTVRKMLVPYDYAPLLDLKEYLMGTAWVDGAGLIQRTLPHHDPDDPTQYVVKVDHRGLAFRGDQLSEVPETPFTTGNRFEYWELTAYLESSAWLIGEGAVDPDDPDSIVGVTPTGVSDETTRFATKVTRPGRDYVTPQAGNLTWLEPSSGRYVPIGFPVPQILPYQEIECTLWFWPTAAYPNSAVENCIGKVNVNAIALPTVPVPARTTADGLGKYRAQTLLLEAARSQDCRFPKGERGNHIHYSLKYRPTGWNRLLGPDGAWREVRRGQTTDGLYETAEFASLFKSEALADVVPFP